MGVRVLLAKRIDNDLDSSLPQFTLTGSDQPVAGRKLYIPIAAWNGIGAVGNGVTDSNANTWTRKDDSAAVSNTRTMIWGCDYSGSGDVTITMTREAGNWDGVYSVLAVLEVDDLISSENDTGARGSAQGSTSGVDASATGAGDTEQARNLYIALFGNVTGDSTANVSVPGDWTTVWTENDGSVNLVSACAYKYVSSIATPSIQFSYDDNSNSWQASIVALKRQAAAGGARRGMMMGMG